MSLIAILLTLSCVIRLLECSRSVQKQAGHGRKEYPVGKKVIKEVSNKVAPHSGILLRKEDKTKVAKSQTRTNGLGVSKDYFQEPGDGSSFLNAISQ